MTAVTETPESPRRRQRVILWTVLLLITAIALVLVLSAMDDVRGKPLLDSPLLQQTLSTIAILGAAFGPSLYANRQDTKVIRHEVKNDHSENMRVENDSRHLETKRWFEGLSKDIGGIRAEIRGDREASRLTAASQGEDIRTQGEDIRVLARIVRKLEGESRASDR